MSELGNSRERIVEAGLAERRRVERNLHDGAQQQLLAVAATLAQTDYVADDEVRGVVSRARATLSDALAELRALARGIHPPALSQGGLPIALPALCERAPWPVELRVDPETRDLPDAIEAATYFVIAEALTNAAKHANATRVTVTVRVADQRATVEIGDDGNGGADAGRGTGLPGLADRVDALDGHLTVRSVPAVGTTVTGEFSCAS
jgi:signal transduction histidine kinase